MPLLLSLNRTLKELKQTKASSKAKVAGSLNRTLKELKLHIIVNIIHWINSLNRTLKELKLFWKRSNCFYVIES